MADHDFSGYVTMAGLKCSDGRTITPQAFAHQDKITVPLVWQHGHSNPDNVLGHVDLEVREDGVYGYGYFNSTPQGQNSKILVEHGDVKAMSIYANQLVEKSKTVLHGKIVEVSLVLSGANPGAKIDYVRVAHSADDIEILEDEAVIFNGFNVEHSDVEHSDVEDEDEDDEDLEHAEKSVAAILATLTPEQKQAVDFVVGEALQQDPEEDDDNSVAQSSTNDSTDSTTSTDSTASSTQTTDEGDLTHQEGNTTVSNVFEKQNNTSITGPTLSHADCLEILKLAQETKSFKEAFKSFASEKSMSHSELAHSITNLELMFPEAKSVTDDPQFISRRMEWVSSVLNGTRKAPFAKIKTLLADITADEARAKGYIKGNMKTEEVLSLLRRTTGPTTIYKKQALDRDDLIDITDFNVVLWLKAEMRMMIEEELARCILVGDGRSVANPDKVKDPMGSNDGIGIRSILHDDPLYSVKVDMAANVSAKESIKGLVRARSKFRGSGRPSLFISDAFLTEILLEEDKFGRRLYESQQEIMDLLRVKEIVTIDLFDDHQDLFCIMVSLSDYTIGTNQGGQLTSFEDFDIDFNKYKYLQETRLSGALVKPYSAVVVRRSVGTLVTPQAPSFDGATNTITIPAQTGVFYTVNDEVRTGSFVITSPTEVTAHPAEGYYFEFNTTRTWTYTP